MVQALVMLACGWVLLVPPVKETGWTFWGISREKEFHVDEKQPYSQWEHHSAYDTAKACESGRYELSDLTYRSMKSKPAELYPDLTEKQRAVAGARLFAFHRARLDARCLPTDVLFSSPTKR